jgi:hypothetical protein
MSFSIEHFEACQAQALSAAMGTSSGTIFSVTSTKNTKGAWTQLVAATAFDIDYLIVILSSAAVDSVSGTTAFDIGIGPSGSEVVLIPNLVFGWANAANHTTQIIPIQIPAGTRVSARFAASTGTNTSDKVSLSLHGFTVNSRFGAGVDALGFVAASTQGTSITPSAAANTKGAYSQIVASTPRMYRAIFGMFDDNNNLTDAEYLFDIAIGAPGSEQIILPNFAVQASQVISEIPFFPLVVPPGTRLSARCQANAANQANLNVTLYGVF